MKTNVNLIRTMGNFEVVQRTKDQMFNATSLIKQWNKETGMKKEVKDFFANNQTQEFINVLIAEENLNRGNYPHLKSSKENTQNSAYLKTRGKYGGTWMHPFLFIKFSMWLNPKFEYHVIKFVYDELVKDRRGAGDYYNKLCAALSKFNDVDYREIGKLLNYVVFNKHNKMIRNIATPEQQKDLHQLERDMCQYIDMGFVNSYSQFKQVMRKEWAKRHAFQLPFPLNTRSEQQQSDKRI